MILKLPSGRDLEHPGTNDRDLLKTLTWVTGLLAIIASLTGLFGNITGIVGISTVCDGCKPIALSAALIWIFFGAFLVWVPHRPITPPVRTLLRFVILVIAFLEAAEVISALAGGRFIVESWSVFAGSLLFGPQSTPISPVASVLIIIAAAGLFSCTDPGFLSPERRYTREIAVFAGIIVMLAGFTFALSYLFGTPLVFAAQVIPIAALSALAAFFIGLSLISAAGPGTFPVRFFVGSSIRARLLRIFVPLTVVITLCETVIFSAISSWFALSSEIVVAASLVIFILVTAIIVGRISGVLGRTLDAAERELADKNADLGKINKELLNVEEQLRQNIATLTQKERDLLESEQFLRETEKIARMGGWIADPQTDFLRWTDGVYDIFGVPRTYQPGFAEGLTFFSKKDQPVIRKNIETCLATGEPFTLEVLITTATKKEVWAEIRGLSPVTEGARSLVIGTFHDVSERRQTEEKLIKETAKLNILADSARLLMSSENPECVVQIIGERVMQFLDCHTFFNYLVDESGQRLQLNACAGISRETAAQIQYLNLGEAVCGKVAHDGERTAVSDILNADDDATSPIRSFGTTAYACHPLIFQGRNIGTLSFGSCNRASFTLEELDLMQAVTDLVTTAMARKKIEDTLRGTSQYLENLIKYANAPIIVWDNEYRILRFNHAFEFLTGMAADTVIGQPLDILFPEESRQYSMELIRKTSSGERWESVEIAVRHVSGAIKIILWNSANIYNADGVTIVSTIAQGQDITGRKSAEERARKTSSLLHAALDSTADGILAVDMARNITSYNKKFCTIWNIPEHVLDSADETIALAYMTPLIADIREFTDRTNDLYSHPGRESYDVVRLKDGRIFERYSIPQIIGDVIVGRVWSYRDITERRRAEEALQESLEKFRIIATSTPDYFLMQDKNLRFTDVINPQLGLTIEEMIGKTDYDIVSKEDADTLTTLKRGVLDSGIAFSGEIPISNKRGEKFYFTGAYVPKRNAAGEVDGILGYFRNVTEKKQADEKLLAAIADKEVLIREIHHRVKNNLQIVTGLLDMTRSRADDPTTTGILTDMMLKIKTMAQIHTRLYESHQSGQVDMGRQIQDMVTDLSNIYGRSGPEISCEVDAGEFSLPVDLAVPCALAVNEILSNSFKHAFKDRRHGTIQVCARKNGNNIHISIRDNGTGIPEEVDPDRTSSLGMKLIRNLTQQVGGSLAIESTGRGTCVNIDFSVGEKG